MPSRLVQHTHAAAHPSTAIAGSSSRRNSMPLNHLPRSKWCLPAWPVRAPPIATIKPANGTPQHAGLSPPLEMHALLKHPPAVSTADGNSSPCCALLKRCLTASLWCSASAANITCGPVCTAVRCSCRCSTAMGKACSSTCVFTGARRGRGAQGPGVHQGS